MKTRAARVLCPSLALTAILGLTVGCNRDGYYFYEVVRTPLEECQILPQGEFCDTDAPSPPVTEVWTVQRRGDAAFVYVNDEVWTVPDAGTDDKPDSIAVEQEQISSKAPGPCVTVLSDALDIEATVEKLSGEWRTKQRLDGPVDCGETPRGTRATYVLTGTEQGAP